MKIRLNVNVTIRETEASDDTPLLWVLRDHLGLTGTKYACGIMSCGACTVLVDGKATRTCAMCGLPRHGLPESAYFFCAQWGRMCLTLVANYVVSKSVVNFL